MSDPFDTDYTLDENAIELGRKHVQPREEWLKMTKGQCLRVAFIYFHSYDRNAVANAVGAAKEKNEKLTAEQIQSVGLTAREERLATLGKPADQVTAADLLDLTEVKMKMFWGSYQEGLGYLVNRLGRDGAEADAVWKKIQEPKLYFTTLLIVYPTNSRGEVTENEKPRLTTDWRVMPWRFSKKTYEKIWTVNGGLKANGLGIHAQDIKLECKDAQYQHIDVSVLGPAIWQRHERFRSLVLAKAMTLYDKLLPFREMTTEQLRSKLGMGGSTVSAGSGSAGDYSDLLDQV
jgi:hypothetical protein